MKHLEKDTRQMIFRFLETAPTMTKEDIKEIVRPHFNFTFEMALEKLLDHEVNSLIASLDRDKENIRQVLMGKMEGKRVAININTCNDVDVLRNVLKINKAKRDGYDKTILKLEQKIYQILNQVTIDSWMNNQIESEAK